MRQRAADIVAVAREAAQDIRKDPVVVGAWYAIGRTGGDDDAGQRPQVADLFRR